MARIFLGHVDAVRGDGNLNPEFRFYYNTTTGSFELHQAGISGTTSVSTLTGAQIKTLYEGESDTNAFDDSALTKLAGIEAGAEVASTGQLAKIGTPTYSTVQELNDTFHSTGLVGGGVMSNNGDGTIAVSAGDGHIRATDSDVSRIYFCEWDAVASVALTDDSVNYVSAQFVDLDTNPTIAVSTTKPADLNTNILLGSVFRSGTENHLTNVSKYNVSNHAKNMIDRLQETQYFGHASGGILSEVGTRQIKVTAGVFWNGLNRFTTIEQDTSGSSPDDNHTFEYFYYNGSDWVTHEETIDAVSFTGSGLDDATSGGTFVGSHSIRLHVEIDANGSPDTFKWSYKGNNGVTVIEGEGVAITGSAQTLVDGATINFGATTGHTIGDSWDFDCYLSDQINNTQYNNTASGLASLSTNKHGIHWVYLDVHGHISVIFGEGNYSLKQAVDASPPASLPPEFETHVRLIGRIIIKKSDSTFESIANNYNATFQASVPTEHSALNGLDSDDHTQYLLVAGSRAMSGKLTLNDSATVGALNLAPRSTVPSAPATNDIYLDDGTNTGTTNLAFRRYNGSSWEDIGTG